jgi:hypothetical protein
MITYLSSNDFKIKCDELYLTHKKHYAFVMFHTAKCKHYSEDYDTFYKTSMMFQINFCICEIADNREVIWMSEKTLHPIEEVPTFILFLNGEVVAKYEGETDEDKMTEWLLDIQNKVNYRMKF